MLFEANSTRAIKTLAIILLFGLCIGVIASHVIFTDHGERVAELSDDHQQLRARIARLRSNTAKLELQLQSLEEGTAGWRELARREHGMLEPGEAVYRFPVVIR